MGLWSVPNACIPPLRLALETLALVLRNSLLCIAVGWLFSYCFTVGNVFTGLPPGQQSYANFSAANIAWFYGVFSMCVVILMATKLLPEQFVSQPSTTKSVTHRLNILQCTAKLLVRVGPHLVLSSVIVVGGDFAMYSIVSASWHRFKPCVYIAAFWGFYIMVIADVFVRHIFQTETVRGLIATGQAPKPSSKTQASTKYHSDVMIQQTHHRRHWKPPFRRFLRIYARNLPVMLFVLIAIVYVHAISQFVSPPRPVGTTGVCQYQHRPQVATTRAGEAYFDRYTTARVTQSHGNSRGDPDNPRRYPSANATASTSKHKRLRRGNCTAGYVRDNGSSCQVIHRAEADARCSDSQGSVLHLR